MWWPKNTKHLSSSYCKQKKNPTILIYDSCDICRYFPEGKLKVILYCFQVVLCFHLEWLAKSTLINTYIMYIAILFYYVYASNELQYVVQWSKACVNRSNHQRQKLIQMKLASVTCSDICLYIYKPNSHPWCFPSRPSLTWSSIWKSSLTPENTK